MKFNLLWAFLLAVSIFLSGCLTIEEHYTFKKNGSGTMNYVLDMTEMAEMMKAFEDEMGEEMKDENGEDPTSDLSELSFSEFVDTLQTLRGISKVKAGEKGEWIHNISFAFNDLDALNNALNVIMNDKGKSTGHEFFKREGNRIIRQHNENAADLGKEMSGEEDDMGILEMMKYKMSYSFKKELKTVNGGSGGNGEVDGKTYEFDTNFDIISKNEGALDLTFEFE